MCFCQNKTVGQNLRTITMHKVVLFYTNSLEYDNTETVIWVNAWMHAAVGESVVPEPIIRISRINTEHKHISMFPPSKPRITLKETNCFWHMILTKIEVCTSPLSDKKFLWQTPKSAPKGPIDNNPALAQIMDLRRIGHKPWSVNQ